MQYCKTMNEWMGWRGMIKNNCTLDKLTFKFPLLSRPLIIRVHINFRGCSEYMALTNIHCNVSLAQMIKTVSILQNTP